MEERVIVRFYLQVSCLVGPFLEQHMRRVNSSGVNYPNTLSGAEAMLPLVAPHIDKLEHWALKTLFGSNRNGFSGRCIKPDLNKLLDIDVLNSGDGDLLILSMRLKRDHAALARLTWHDVDNLRVEIETT